MADPVKIVEREEDSQAEMAEFFKDMRPMTTRDSRQLLAYYHHGLNETFGGRVMFDVKERRIILEIKRNDDSIEVSCSLNEFIRKVTRVAIAEIWSDAGVSV